MKTIVCVIGTRPQLIKHSVVLKELEKAFVVKTVNTMQHYQTDLNETFIKELFPGGTNFHTTSLNNQFSPAERLGEMILKIASVLKGINADAVLVYGDTDSTLAGALAARKTTIPLIHIEAGERSFNKDMPEETNRILTDMLADIFFCSSTHSINHLQKEGITKNVFLSGDVMKDLLLVTSGFLTAPPDKNYLFCTIHRSYNKSNPNKLKQLFDALQRTGKKIIFPVHPATMQSFARFGIQISNYGNIQTLAPLPYRQSLSYQKFADAVITDSGGIQKEAYWLKKPCITIRKETEWEQTLKGNWNQLLYDDLERLPEILNHYPEEGAYDKNLYGKGNASGFIKETLLNLI